MKYKAGDKVRVRRDLEVGIDYGKRAVVPEMTNLKGMIATIKSVGRDYYELEEDIDLFDWTDEMIEGLWEECKSTEQVSKSEGKYKLIDILNKIANGELKEGTKLKFEECEYIYENSGCEESYDFYNSNGNTIFEDYFMGAILESEVELIEPDHFTDVGKMAEHFREDTKMIEPTDNTKIEELDVLEIRESQNIDNIGLANLIGDLSNEIREIQHKLNEVIRYINKED